MKTILSKKFLKYFLIAFSIHSAILLIYFTSRYSDDIFSGRFAFEYIIKLLFHSFISMINISLTSGFLIAIIFAFKRTANKGKSIFKKEIISGIALTVSFSLLLLGFNNWVLPSSNLEVTTLIYDMRATGPGEQMHRTDKSVFKDHQSMMPISGINQIVDSLDREIEKYKSECYSLLATLDDSTAKERYDNLNLAIVGIEYTFSNDSSRAISDIYKNTSQLSYLSLSLKTYTDKKQKCISEKHERYTFPILH